MSTCAMCTSTVASYWNFNLDCVICIRVHNIMEPVYIADESKPYILLRPNIVS